MKLLFLILLLIDGVSALEIKKKLIPQNGSVTATVSISSTGNTTWQDLEVLGTMTTSTIAVTSLDLSGTLTSATVDINGGNIDGTEIGATATSAGQFTNVTADNLTGTLQTAAQPNITSIGSASRLTATDFDGTNGNFTNVSGTLTTAAQPNITSIGSASRLTATNFDGTNGNFTNVTGTLQTAAQANITSLGILSSVDIDGGFIDGTPIGQTSASNAVFGILTATTGNITTINATTINGTIATATQASITDIGTQASVDIDGGFIDGTPIGQTSASNAVFGIVTATTGNFTTGNITTINGTIATATQPNITSLGTLSSLRITGNTTSSVLYITPSAEPGSPVTGTIWVYDADVNDAVCVRLDGVWIEISGNAGAVCP